MIANAPNLTTAARAAKELRRRAEVRPWDGFRPLPLQYEFLTDPSPRKLLRAGNQDHGKSTGSILDVLGYATGLHPWADPDTISPDPIEAWVVTASWSQGIALQQKVWEWAPKDLVHPETVFSEVRGFRGKHPALRIRHVSGGWSIIRFKTVQQGGINLAGATVQYILLDEPPAQRVFSECINRVSKAGRFGRLTLAMTPVNCPGGIEWLQTEVEQGEIGIVDHHHVLDLDAMVPVGQTRPLVLPDGTVCDADWLVERRRQVLPHEAPVVLDGRWNFAAEAPIFVAFKASGPGAHVNDDYPVGDVDLLVGVDHGLADHSQVAVLVAVAWPLGKTAPPKVWVLDEAIGDGMTTEEDDADALLTMLERHGIKWSELRSVNGDRAHHGSNRRGSVAKKSNAQLSKAIENHPRARKHGVRNGLISPKLMPAKRGASNQPGSVSYGCTWLHRLMLRDGHFNVSPRCTEVTKALQGYDMTPNSEESHLVDALRYSLRDLIFARGGTGNGPKVLVY